MQTWNNLLRLLVLLSLTTVFSGTAHAGTPVFLTDLSRPNKDGLENGWELKNKSGTPKVYIDTSGGVSGLCIRCDNASSSIQRKIDVDVKEYPYISWSWKVKELPKDGDFRVSGKDDQAAQLFIAFGRKSICYIWDTTARIGSTDTFCIPLTMEVRIIVLRSGSGGAGAWDNMTRNVYEDYKKLYGAEPPHAAGLRFQVNSQHTGTVAEGCIRRIEFQRTITAKQAD